MGETTMDPLEDYHHYTPYDEVVEKSVKVRVADFRIFPGDAILLFDFGTTPVNYKIEITIK